ncbi:MAG: 50S ribosomal protein L30 [Methanosarcinales archaeon]|uniref:Large ribosomal subunit protein uL30 n=1 Tax=Candidatus Ethanoperedens thermophilum TaxID=2766897 RepID=A0A848DA20_9EURY|nr:50S ribosomal protein L30 [Candidatus Ethanoperedens thermophilum]
MYAAIRIRGSVNIRSEIEDTLRMLRLNRVNHCVVVDENLHYKGMIQKVTSYIAWGEISSESLSLILKNRGELVGRVKLTDDYVAENTTYASIDELSEAVCNGGTNLKNVPKLRYVFRLHPPRKGHRGIKKTYTEGGALGYHGEEIASLLKKMR